jgi:uncharacterized membrane protein
MKWNERGWLNDRLADWRARGLIEEQQVRAIERYESETLKRFNPMLVLAGLGGLLLALGVILIISHNWDLLGAQAKELGFLLVLGLAALAASQWEAKPWAGAGIMVLWLGLPLAGIGLWAQIYQLSGDPLKPLLLWLLLSSPLAWLARQRVAAFWHTAGLVWALFAGCFCLGTWLTLATRTSYQAPDQGPDPALWVSHAVLALLLWILAFVQAGFRLGTRARVALVMAAAVFAAGLGFATTPLQAKNTYEGFVLVSGLAACVWWAAKAWGMGRGELRALGFGLTAAICYGATFTYHLWNRQAGEITLGGALWACPWAAAGLALTALGPLTRDDVDKPWMFRLSWGLALGLSLAGLAGLLADWAVALLANLALVGLCVLWMFEAARWGERRLLNLCSLMLGLLVLTRFIDVFGSLLRSGMGFLTVGAVFLAVSWGIQRGRKSLLDRAAGGRP